MDITQWLHFFHQDRMLTFGGRRPKRSNEFIRRISQRIDRIHDSFLQSSSGPEPKSSNDFDIVMVDMVESTTAIRLGVKKNYWWENAVEPSKPEKEEKRRQRPNCCLTSKEKKM